MATMQVIEAGWRPPTRVAALGFWLRSRLLIGWHSMRTLGRRPARHARSDAMRDAPVIVTLRVPIWSDTDSEFALTAGKVQNLRVAIQAFDGVVVPAGAALSFWRQLGKPTARRGFTRGREVRAGCVIPTIAGGICQLSNALATCAMRAGFDLLERHRHTARIGTDESDQIDATVFWNYVDLKIRASVDWRIEAKLDATALIVAFRAQTTDTCDLPSPGRPDSPAARAHFVGIGASQLLQLWGNSMLPESQRR